MEEKEKLEQEIRNLQSELTADTSIYGDWKLIKYNEYIMQGIEAPYTKEEMDDYHNIRQKKRDRINKIKVMLEEYNGESKGKITEAEYDYIIGE